MTSEVSPLGPGCYHELRIHGVAGSSPESMLGFELLRIDGETRVRIDVPVVTVPPETATTGMPAS